VVHDSKKHHPQKLEITVMRDQGDSENWLPLATCVRGHVYRLHSRNLDLGVFNGETGFLGLREKFGSRYLFCEYHWETGAPFGTVYPLEDLGLIPEDLVIAESLGLIDHRNRRPVAFDRPISEGGRGWYYLDSGKANQKIVPQGLGNEKLFDWLTAFELQYS
jgi:hypothetical protein